METNKRYKLLLISPEHTYRNMWTLKEVAELMGTKTAAYPLALPLLASLTPENYSIKLVDEEVERIPFNFKADIVGITSMVTNVKRGYEIADKFRKKGVTVIMGGSFTTINHKVSLEHADSVVIGEAEMIWKKLLSDFEKGNLKKIYKDNNVPDITNIPLPRWELVDIKKLLCINVQVSRGCPFSCDFCCVTKVYGFKQRYRSIDNVIEEIKSLPLKRLSFVDDNLTANKKYARELMKRLKPLKVTWTCLCSIDVANDEKLLNDMADAGCTSILIGLESLNPEGLKEVSKKHQDPEKFKNSIMRIHNAGIHVIGSFIVGFDSDKEEAYERIYKYCIENNISLVMLNMLTVFSGTRLYDKMKKKKRLLPVNPEYLNGIFPSMKYKNFDTYRIFDLYWKTLRKIYNYDSIKIIMDNLFKNGKFIYKRGNIVTVREKIIFCLNLAKYIFLSFKSDRIKFFIDIMKLVSEKKLSLDMAFEYLILILGIDIYLRKYSKRQKEFKRKLKNMISISDRGDVNE